MDDHETSTNEAIALLSGELHDKARTLNQLAQGPPGLTEPTAAYTLLENLAQTAVRFGQAAEQVDEFLTAQLDSERLGHDDGDDPVPIVTTIHNALGRATEQATDLGETFLQAAESLIPIHGLDDGEQSPVKQATVNLVGQADAEVETASQDFPKPIGDVLSNPASSEQAIASEPRSSPQVPHPRRER